MTDRILKWTIPVDDKQHHVEGVPLFAGSQDPLKYEEVVVWTGNTGSTNDDTTRKIQVFATGQPLPEKAEYIWTVLCAGGALVWHVFDVTNVKVPIVDPPSTMFSKEDPDSDENQEEEATATDVEVEENG